MTIIGDHHSKYTEAIDGFWGRFSTPGGVVDYLECKAHLGNSGPPLQRKMVQHLRPVREVLPVEEMDFDQLLQRDLEDHRIARDLIPYLLGEKATRPAFFPSILCVLLPFKGSTPEALPSRTSDRFEDPSGMSFNVTEYGDCFAVEKLAAQGDELSEIHYGRVRWNSDRAKLVVLDGQHRAMAALAVHRTINEAWGDSSGSKYKLFYEAVVKDLLEHNSPPELSLPVTIFWLPEITNDSKTPHRVARQIFVDVNNNAKRPNEARLILLSEDKLHRVLTREFLDRVRHNFPSLPLYAVEYDTPGEVTVDRQRWSSLTNIGVLEEAVKRAVFGPSYLVKDLQSPIKAGVDPWVDMSSHMRNNLGVYDIYDEIVIESDREFKRGQISNDLFPWEDRQPLLDRFWEKYGLGIATLLSSIHPYRTHLSALADLKEKWPQDTNEGALSFEALFVGTGMYWTLRDLDRSARDTERPMAVSPDAKQAWAMISKRKEFFRLSVARVLLDIAQPEEADVAKANTYLDRLTNLAAQVGLVMAWVALCENAQIADTHAFAKACSETINLTFESSPRVGNGSLVLVLDKNAEDPRGGGQPLPLNLLTSLDRPRWVQWRYLWLELLDVGHCSLLESAGCSRQTVTNLRLDAQVPYLDWITRQGIANERLNDPGKTDDVYRSRSRARAKAALRSAQEVWLRCADSGLLGSDEGVSEVVDELAQQESEADPDQAVD